MELFRNSLQEHNLLSELVRTENMTRDNSEPLDELQLAALLGKTLLEKNEELESKLKKLQDFAKETILANETLTRQLAEARDSLEYSNRIYEQLEVKLEESDASKRRLQKAHRTTQALLEKKTSGLADLDRELMQVRLEREDLYSELDKFRKQVNESAASKEKFDVGRNSRSPRRERTPGMVGPFEGDSLDDDASESEQEEVARLRKAVRDLSVKLQSSVSRKNQLEREMEELVADNTGLTHTLEKMEGDMSSLQQRLEEAQERNKHILESTQEPITPAMTQHRPAMQFQLPLTSPKAAALACESGLSTDSGSGSKSDTEPTNSESLFSELDQEYSSLQDKYQRLLDSCVCSVGQAQRGDEDTETGLSTEKKTTDRTASGEGKFKELFDELFSTLRETAQVADKLIESRSSKANKE